MSLCYFVTIVQTGGSRIASAARLFGRRRCRDDGGFDFICPFIAEGEGLKKLEVRNFFRWRFSRKKLLVHAFMVVPPSPPILEKGISLLLKDLRFRSTFASALPDDPDSARSPAPRYPS